MMKYRSAGTVILALCLAILLGCSAEIVTKSSKYTEDNFSGRENDLGPSKEALTSHHHRSQANPERKNRNARGAKHHSSRTTSRFSDKSRVGASHQTLPSTTNLVTEEASKGSKSTATATTATASTSGTVFDTRKQDRLPLSELKRYQNPSATEERGASITNEQAPRDIGDITNNEVGLALEDLEQYSNPAPKESENERKLHALGVPHRHNRFMRRRRRWSWRRGQWVLVPPNPPRRGFMGNNPSGAQFAPPRTMGGGTAFDAWKRRRRWRRNYYHRVYGKWFYVDHYGRWVQRGPVRRGFRGEPTGYAPPRNMVGGRRMRRQRKPMGFYQNAGTRTNRQRWRNRMQRRRWRMKRRRQFRMNNNDTTNTTSGLAPEADDGDEDIELVDALESGVGEDGTNITVAN